MMRKPPALQQVVLGRRRSITSRGGPSRPAGGGSVRARSSRPVRAQMRPTTVAAMRLASEPSRHDLRLTREGHRRRHQHDRVDRRRRQEEGEPRPRGPAVHQSRGDRHGAALAAGQGDPGHGRDGDGESRPGGQDPREELGGDERGDGRADGHPEHQEGHRLHHDRHEHRRPVGDRGLVEQVLEQRPEQRCRHHDERDDRDAGLDPGDARRVPGVSPARSSVRGGVVRRPLGPWGASITPPAASSDPSRCCAVRSPAGI